MHIVNELCGQAERPLLVDMARTSKVGRGARCLRSDLPRITRRAAGLFTSRQSHRQLCLGDEQDNPSQTLLHLTDRSHGVASENHCCLT